MKIVFLLPSIKNSGGVARVTALKINYIIEKWNYEVHVISQDVENSESFFNLNNKSTIYCLPKNKGEYKYILYHYNKVNALLKKIQPNVVIVCDNGFKGFMAPYLVKKTENLILEVHGSRFEYIFEKSTFFGKLKNRLKIFGLKKFKKVIFLNNESAKEWNYKDPIIIPNPLPFQSTPTSNLNTKKVLCIARHSYEKGIDRLLKIWKNVSRVNPDWQLEIVGEETDYSKYLFKLVSLYQLENSVIFKKPVANISTSYLDASVYVMTSRFEGFGLVLIEAMSCGLPVIAYNCEIGPGTIIENNVNGFLIDDGNAVEFEYTLNQILKDKIDLKNSIRNGIATSKKYDLMNTLQIWIKNIQN